MLILATSALGQVLVSPGAHAMGRMLAAHPQQRLSQFSAARLRTAGAPLERIPPPVSSIRLPAAVGTNVQISPNDRNVRSTVSVAADPGQSGALFASSEVATAPPVEGSLSLTRGTSWSTRPLPLPATGPNLFAIEPSAVIEGGTLLDSYTAVGHLGNGFGTQLVVNRSTDGGNSWGQTVVEGVAATAERSMLSVDATGGRFANRLYLAYDTNPSAGSEPVVVARSDGGAWSKTVVYDSGGDYGAMPAVGPNGEVYVVWSDYAAMPQAKLLVARSVDGGQTFRAPAFVATTSNGFGAALPNFGNSAPPCPSTSPTITPTPSLAVDRSSGPRRGAVYVAWADAPGGTMHINFASSFDGGASWVGPTQLDLGNHNDAWEPALAVDQSTGALIVAWYDRRDDPANKLTNVYVTESYDGGLSFLPVAMRVTSRPTDPTLDCFGTGSYMGLAAANGTAHPVWSDTRNGINQIFTAAVSESALGSVLLRSSNVFSGALTYPVGGRAGYTVAADLNGDGRPDIAALSNDGLTVLLNQGDGTFQPAAPPRYWQAGPFAVGDFNGDGRADLATGSGIQLGLGNGLFRQGTSYSTCSPGSIVSGDFNNDGKLDLVMGGGMCTGVDVLLGQGDGTFSSPLALSLGPQPDTTNAVTVADFNHDGNPDVVATEWNGVAGFVTVLPGDGHGNFGAPIKAGVGGHPAGIAVADFNKDGKPDVAITVCGCGAGADGLFVMSGTGDGRFGTPMDSGVGSPTGDFAAGDLNGDGFPDLVMAYHGDGGNRDPGHVFLLLGKGDGSFQPPTSFTTELGPDAVALADYNGDNKLDLAVANEFSGDVEVMAGRGDGSVARGPEISAGQSAAVTAGDFNGDGIPDLAVTNQVGNPVTGNVDILLGVGDGSFQQGASFNAGSGINTPGSIVSADFNGDGKLDLAMTTGAQYISLAIGKGDGSFASVASVATPSVTDQVVVGDFNRDGKADLAIGGGNSVSVLLGNGDGTFRSGGAYPVLTGPLSLTSGDLNGDGIVDLVATDSPNDVSVLIGHGDGTFASAVHYPAGPYPAAVVVADFNGDHRMDVAVLNSPNFGLTILMGRGDGTLGVPITDPSVTSGYALIAGDFNHDGKTDLAITNGYTVTIRQGIGDGTFERPINYPAGGARAQLVIADFNRDGWLDLATADVRILLGLAPSGPRPPAATSPSLRTAPPSGSQRPAMRPGRLAF